MTKELGRGTALANGAANFIGKRFRLHGRDPEHGLDCIGLVASSLKAMGENPITPEGYCLRNTNPSRWINYADGAGFERVEGEIKAGDLLLVQFSPIQHHLMIAANEHEAIHAHAGLRRIVRQAFACDLKIEAHWRLR